MYSIKIFNELHFFYKLKDKKTLILYVFKKKYIKFDVL